MVFTLGKRHANGKGRQSALKQMLLWGSGLKPKVLGLGPFSAAAETQWCYYCHAHPPAWCSVDSLLSPQPRGLCGTFLSTFADQLGTVHPVP
jgi:hypothetical protein